jgi:hypothetical protein
MADIAAPGDGGLAGLEELLAEVAVGEELVEPLGQVLRIFGSMEEAAAEFGQSFGKAAVLGHHHRDAAGEGFKDEDAFGLFVGSGDGQDVDGLQEIQLAAAIDFADVGEGVFQPGSPQLGKCFLGILPILAPQPAGDS